MSSSPVPCRRSPTAYLPDEVEPEDRLIELYTEQAAILAPHVDLFIAETLTTVQETRAAAIGAAATGKPVWIGWSLHEDKTGCLKGGATVAQAAASVSPISRSAPSWPTAARPKRSPAPCRICWPWARPPAVTPTPSTPSIPARRTSATATTSASTPMPTGVQDWINGGARIVGGCCGTLPEHIARVRQVIDAGGLSASWNGCRAANAVFRCRPAPNSV